MPGCWVNFELSLNDSAILPTEVSKFSIESIFHPISTYGELINELVPDGNSVRNETISSFSRG